MDCFVARAPRNDSVRRARPAGRGCGAGNAPSGNGASGSTRSAMTRISPRTWIMSISTQSSTAMSAKRRSGRIRRSSRASGADFTRKLGLDPMNRLSWPQNGENDAIERDVRHFGSRFPLLDFACDETCVRRKTL